MFSIACLASPRPPALLARGNPRGSGAVDLAGSVTSCSGRTKHKLSVISRHCHHLVIKYVKKSSIIHKYYMLH